MTSSWLSAKVRFSQCMCSHGTNVASKICMMEVACALLRVLSNGAAANAITRALERVGRI
jgi:hypothetical protein